MADNITQEEIDAELALLEGSGRISRKNRNIDREVNAHKRTKIIIIIILAIVVLLCLFVWLSSLSAKQKNQGYLIQIIDKDNYYGNQNSQLKLAYDPNFTEEYLELIGLGYGDVGALKGGSLLEHLEMNTTMFDKFKEFAETAEMAATYEKNEGQANFDQYYANKFYLKNEGDTTISYRLNLEIVGNHKDALDAARFMIVTGDEISGYEYQIFATPPKDSEGNVIIDEDGNIAQEMAAVANYKTAVSNYLYFADPNSNGSATSTNPDDAWLCENLVYNSETNFYNYLSCEEGGVYFTLAPQEVVCYTICVWFEGSDDDHNNNIIGGGIEFSIKFETEEYVKYISEEKEVENN